MGSEMSSETNSKVLKQYTSITNDCSCSLRKMYAAFNDLMSSPIYQKKKSEIDQNFEMLKSNLNGLKSEIETDIQTFNAIKRSIIRLEEIFKTLSDNNTKIIENKTHKQIKTIVYDQILAQIINYQKNLENRKNFNEFQKKLQNSKILNKKPIATGVGAGAGVGVAVGASAFLAKLGFGGMKEYLIVGVLSVIGAILSYFWTLNILESVEEKIGTDKNYGEFFSKLQEFHELFKELSEVCNRPLINLGEVKELCENFCENNEDLIRFIHNREICSILKKNIDECVDSQNKLKEAIDKMK